MIKELEEIYSHKVELDLSKMVKVSKTNAKQLTCDNKYRYIIYFDSLQCSSCVIDKLFLAEGIQNDMKKLNYDVDFVFIFSTKKSIKTINEAYYNSRCHYPIYIDTLNHFISENIFIPANSMLHAFFIDKNGTILFVGNPLTNTNIEKLLFEKLESMK